MRDVFAFLRVDPKLALYGLMIAFGSSFGQTFFISQFGGVFRTEFGLTDGSFGSIYGAATLLSAAVIVYTGSIIDRLDLRRWTVALIVAFAGACAFMASVTGAVSLFIAIFLLRQFGQGLMSHTMGTSLARYHDSMRGKALAFGGYGYPVAEAVMPILAVAIISLFDWRTAWIVFAAALLLLWLPLCRALLHGHDRRHSDYLNRLDAEARFDAGEAEDSESADWVRSRARHWRRREVLRDPRFYLVMPAIVAPSLIITALFLHGVKVAEVKGWSHAAWATSLAAYAGASIPSSLLFGAWIDRVGAIRGLAWFSPPLAIACFLLGIGENPAFAWIFMAVAGVSGGILSVLSSAFWAEVYGTRHLGEIRAMTTACMVFSSAAGPPIMGLMLDYGFTVAATCYFFAGLGTMGALLSLVAMSRYARP